MEDKDSGESPRHVLGSFIMAERLMFGAGGGGGRLTSAADVGSPEDSAASMPVLS